MAGASAAAVGEAPAAGRFVVSPLIGRHAELDRLVAAVCAPPAVAVLTGEAGIGKTRMVAELVAHPALVGRRTVIGGCRRIREPFPLGPFVEALRGLRDGLAAADLSPVAGALRPLLPELADVLPPRLEPLEDRAAARHQVFRGLVAVLTSLAPATVVVEDMHWADDQTVEFLGYLTADPPAGLSIVVTYRPEDTPPSTRTAIARLPAAVRREQVTLAPLDAAQTGAFTAALLQTDKVSVTFASYLCQRASGLPLAIQELLALLRERDLLVQRGARWTRRVLEELDVPAGIRDQVLERVGRLSRPARAVVEAAAVMQAPVPAAVLLAVAGTDAPQGWDGLAEALESGLLTDDETTVEFRHVLAAQAVYDGIAGPLRRERHARASVALRQLDPVPTGHVAHHLYHSGRLAEWTPAAEAAADQATGLGHDGEAARLLADLLRHAPLDTGSRGHIAVKLARAALASLQVTPEVPELLTAAITDDLPRVVRGELRFSVVALQLADMDPQSYRDHLVSAVADLDDRPDLKAWAMMALGLPVWPGGTAATHQRWLHRALETLAQVHDPVVVVFLLGKIAMVLASMGDPRWRPASDRMQRTGDTPRHPREVNAYQSVGQAAGSAGHHALAERLLTAAREGAEACRHKMLEHRVRASLTLLDFCRGSWDGLQERIDDLHAEAAPDSNVVDLDAAAGCLALARGDTDAGRLAALVARLEQCASYDILPVPVAAWARLAAARNDAGPVLAVLTRLTETWETGGLWAPAARAVPPLTEVLIVAGQPDRARTLVKRFAAAVRKRDAPLAPAALRHARAHLDAAAGRWPAATVRFLAAADQYHEAQRPYEAAQAREQAAVCMFAADDPRAADTLRAATDTYRNLGALWDLQRADRHARQHGMSVPARHRGGRRGYGSRLSPREYEVAAIAATGQTNREIATALFLSPKTVDKHLSAALRKLGLRSRTALADHPQLTDHHQLNGADAAKNGVPPP